MCFICTFCNTIVICPKNCIIIIFIFGNIYKWISQSRNINLFSFCYSTNLLTIFIFYNGSCNKYIYTSFCTSRFFTIFLIFNCCWIICCKFSTTAMCTGNFYTCCFCFISSFTCIVLYFFPGKFAFQFMTKSRNVIFLFTII